ncbi:uncharacterized protein VICG_00522 [Vittaforma corneae ATCC 50505]|uniref:Uncharacterized protein n=1 Tax=Vittaforma corneae (strain ATCC 50505) TaxID=993615 RepID=L2GNF1_VITCO|nr:uncharacterized protein VICG_00522 [Vittaforma corneae ATCC 50505]ELA42423.1 hypothetical protein VICG_00522 [Vittaforma corneae ATCC 50505]
MTYYDFFRNLILSSPNKICDASTIYTYLTEELYTNTKLQVVVGVSVVFIAFILFIVYCKAWDAYSRYIIYLLGLQIFFIALMFKISKSGFGSELSNLDQKLYNALKGMDESKTSAFSSIVLFLLTKMHSNSNISKCEAYKVNRNTSIEPSNSIFSSYLAMPLKDKNDGIKFKHTKKSKILLDASGMPDLKLDSPINENVSLNGGNGTVFEHANFSKNVLTPFRNEKIYELKPHKDEKATMLQSTDVKDEKISTPTSALVKNEKTKELAIKKEISPERNTSSDDNLNTVTENKIIKTEALKVVDDDSDINNDPYFSDVLRTLNNEFTTNNKLSGSFKEIAKIIDKTDNEVLELDASLKKLINLGSSIEKELKSFNVSLRGIENIRSQLITTLRKMLPVKFIIDNLNYKESSDRQLNQIFKADDGSDNHEFTHNPNDNKNIVTAVQICLISQAIVCIIFFIQVLTNGSIYALRMVSVILLGADIILGILVMALAHFYDKDCVLGRVPNCGSIFSKSFTQFAKSANLDLKSTEMSKVEALNKSLNKIGTRTNNITTFLKDMFEDNLIGEYRVYNAQLKNMLDKLNFIKDDFKELTHGKVDNNEFFSLVDSIELRLSQISQNVSLVNPKFLFEFYTKEVIFGNYIKTEKDRIIANSEKQMGDRILKNKWRNKKECEAKWKDVCNKKEKLDQLSLLMVFGSFIFMIGFAVL